ncbi:MAG: T9SS type A sorting domain-containing protein [Ignavibacteriae bacterium]|nr:T9SS type A sorting domain-containing protein [Ignavibacteriota bacterium]
MSWMTVDQKNGHIYIVFYDRRNYSNTATDVYIARSIDGGNTFTNFIVSSSSFTPTSTTFFGDYTNITAYNGRVRPIWARLQGTLSVMTALVDFTTGENTNSENLPDEFKLVQNYPNPFNPSTTINYSIKENTFVSLKVYNLMGQEITTLVNMNKPAGYYSINFDSKEYGLSSGVYFYKLTAGNFSDTKKMIITK